VRIDTRAPQTLEHCIAREQRDLALGGFASEQHGDLAEPFRAIDVPARIHRAPSRLVRECRRLMHALR
jgi:hypothetical protein